MKVKKLILKEFSAFRDAKLEFSPGLNVFIGENATGKSHVMKVIYCILRSMEPPRGRGRPLEPKKRLTQKLSSVFMPDNEEIGRLVRRTTGRKTANVTLGLDGHLAEFKLSTLGTVKFSVKKLAPTKSSIFIPSREVLAMYDGFIAAYNERELSFDETYHDLCVALSAKPLRGRREGGIAKLIKPLEEILDGKVTLSGNRFHVKSKEGIIEAHLLAEGYRKIASIVYLIGNGSLVENGILFWDEPEANLNPQLITRVAEVLRSLASGGVQVFISTHDYLLSHELSIAVEYQKKPLVDSRFFAFSRKRPGHPVKVESGETLIQLKNNAILEEFAAHYDREHELFSKCARSAKEGKS